MCREGHDCAVFDVIDELSLLSLWQSFFTVDNKQADQYSRIVVTSGPTTRPCQLGKNKIQSKAGRNGQKNWAIIGGGGGRGLLVSSVNKKMCFLKQTSEIAAGLHESLGA